MATVPKALTANAGEYYVAFLLTKAGYAVGLTGRGTPHIDLLVTNPISGKSLSIQVKTMRNAYATNRAGDVWWKWRAGKAALESARPNVYWAFVDLQEDKPGSPPPNVYFLSPSAIQPELSSYGDPPDVWFGIEEPVASKYRNNLPAVQKELE